MKRFILATLLLALPGCGPSVSQPYTQRVTSSNTGYGQVVYDTGECIGPVVGGICHGGILPQHAYHQRCYGEMLFGQCTGPMF